MEAEREALRFEKFGQCVSCGGFNKLGRQLAVRGMSGLLKAREKWLKDSKFYMDVYEVWKRQDVFVEMCRLRREVVMELCRGGQRTGRRTFWRPVVELSEVF